MAAKHKGEHKHMATSRNSRQPPPAADDFIVLEEAPVPSLAVSNITENSKLLGWVGWGRRVCVCVRGGERRREEEEGAEPDADNHGGGRDYCRCL